MKPTPSSPASPSKARRVPRQISFPNLLRRSLWLLLYALPATLFFSYHPVISLGANSSMNFEFSLPLIWLIVFDVLSLIAMLWLNSKARSHSTREPKATARLSTTASRHQAVSTHSKKMRPRLLANQPNFPGLTDRRFFLLAIFPLYLTISTFWSANPLRGLLTAGVMWAVFFAVFALLFILPQLTPPRHLRTHALLAMFISTVLVCLFCYIQSIMDTIGFSRDTTLLCAGCTYRSFGFPHPSGFAIEPQFMGNLLLAPTLTALYLVVFRHPASARKWPRFALILLAGFLSTTLFFTFSRGAIYAYAVALFILLIFALTRHHFRWHLVAIPVVSFALSLTLQGTFAAVGPTSETFVSGVTKSLHQLSLGLIDLRPSSRPQSVENSPQDSGKLVENQPQNGGNPVDNSTQNVDNFAPSVDNSVLAADNSTPSIDSSSAIFDGYVPESTNTRLNLNVAALSTWLSAPGHAKSPINIGLQCLHSDPCTASGYLTPTSVLFGVGLGGAGTAMYKNRFITGITSPKEIVQNQFFSLLLETGLVGIALAVFGLLIVFAPQLFSRKFLDGKSATHPATVALKAATTPKSSPSPLWRHPTLPLLLALILAYLVTLSFFSGLPNALQIYLMPPFLYLIFLSPSSPPVKNSPAVRGGA